MKVDLGPVELSIRQPDGSFKRVAGSWSEPGADPAGDLSGWVKDMEKLPDGKAEFYAKMSPRSRRKLNKMLAQLEPEARERSRRRTVFWTNLAMGVCFFLTVAIVVYGVLLFLAL